LVADHMRASSSSVASMLPDHSDWLVACDDDVAVCLQCLLDDDAAGAPRFRRRDWAECWRVRCLRHRAILVDMPDWRSCRLVVKRQEVVFGLLEFGHGWNASNALVGPVPVVVVDPGFKSLGAVN